MIFSQFIIYLDNFHRPKSNATMHTCDVKFEKNWKKNLQFLILKHIQN